MSEITGKSVDKYEKKHINGFMGLIKESGFYSKVDCGFILRQENNKKHLTTYYSNKNTKPNLSICRINVSQVHIRNNKIWLNKFPNVWYLSCSKPHSKLSTSLS